jgi:hypothetical protein
MYAHLAQQREIQRTEAMANVMAATVVRLIAG